MADKKNLKIVVVSDAHLGYNASTDSAFKKMVETMVKTVVKEKNDKLILLGDIFEFWLNWPLNVLVEYAELLDWLKREIRNNKVVYLWGNHDWHFSKIPNQDQLWPGEEEYVYDYEYKENGETKKKIQFRFIHGFQFENREAFLAGNAIFYYMNKNATGFLHKLWCFWKRLTNPTTWKLMQRPGKRLKQKELDDIQKKAVKWQAKHLSPNGEKPWIIYGHTHKHFIMKEDRIANTGCWLVDHDSKSPKHEYLVITIEDGKVTVKKEEW